jgi:hypothetical protein
LTAEQLVKAVFAADDTLGGAAPASVVRQISGQPKVSAAAFEISTDILGIAGALSKRTGFGPLPGRLSRLSAPPSACVTWLPALVGGKGTKL